MADPARDSLLREIDEDLRHERYAQLWKRYGHVVIALAVMLVVAVAGYEAWKTYQLNRRAEAGERFSSAIALAQTDPDAAATVFADLAENGPEGYRILARLREAAILVRQGDIATAEAVYDNLAAETDDPLYVDLALLLKAMAAMKDDVTTAEAASLQEQLAPLTAADRPWRYTAQELSAVLALKAGETNKARDMFTALSTDVQAPEGVRSRAESMLIAIGNGT